MEIEKQIHQEMIEEIVSKIFVEENTEVRREQFVIKMSGQCKDYLNPHEVRAMFDKKVQELKTSDQFTFKEVAHPDINLDEFNKPVIDEVAQWI